MNQNDLIITLVNKREELFSHKFKGPFFAVIPKSFDLNAEYKKQNITLRERIAKIKNVDEISENNKIVQLVSIATDEIVVFPVYGSY